MLFPDETRYNWLENHCRYILGRCERVVDTIPGVTLSPVRVYVPGGDDKYPSFWIRDAVMQCRSGMVSVDDMEGMLRIALAHQNGPTRRDLANGLRIDPWSVADHINLPGMRAGQSESDLTFGAVFFPGTYSPSDDQGNGAFGLRPADDDIYELVELARLIVAAGRPEVLSSEITGAPGVTSGTLPVIERLDLGMQTMVTDEETGLCLNTPGDWAAANFHDALRPMGLIALTSCLRYRAAVAMAGLFRAYGNSERAGVYEAIGKKIAASVVARLQMPNGWLMAGSEIDRQPDLWSTAMAVYYGLLAGESRDAACEAMLEAYRDGTLSTSGYLRHTPTNFDHIPGEQTWEHGGGKSVNDAYGIYQFGGYWPQPLGYYAWAISLLDPAAAVQICSDFVDHTKAEADDGAPFEWINPNISRAETPGLGRWYGPSVTLPLEGFRRIAKGLGEQG